MRTFASHRWRHATGWGDPPGATAIVGEKDPELAVDGVAHGKTSLAVEERQAVVERGRLVVLEGQVPGGAAVGGAIDPRALAWTRRQHHGVVAVERLDVMKIEVLGAGRGDVAPGPATINRPHDDARRVRAARGPDSVPIDDIDPEQCECG